MFSYIECIINDEDRYIITMYFKDGTVRIIEGENFLMLYRLIGEWEEMKKEGYPTF